MSRTSIINIRVDPRGKQAALEAAEYAKQPLSNWVRGLIAAEIKRMGFVPSEMWCATCANAGYALTGCRRCYPPNVLATRNGQEMA